MIKAVIFDAIGTLVNMASPIPEYEDVITLAEDADVGLSLNDFYLNDTSLNDTIPEGSLSHHWESISMIEDELEKKLKGARLYADTSASLDRLREMGLKIGVCANTTHEQAKRLRFLLPDVDCMVLSNEFGVMKPDHRAFAEACKLLRVSPDEVLMIGSSYTEDYLPATAMGMIATHLVRSEQGEKDLAYCVSRVERNIADRVKRQRDGLAPWEAVPSHPSEWEARA